MYVCINTEYVKHDFYSNKESFYSVGVLVFFLCEYALRKLWFL